MTKQFWGGLCAAVVALGIVVAIVWFSSQKNHLVITGKIIRVRVVSIEPQASLVMVDFRVTNPSAVLFVSREASLKLEPEAGAPVDGLMVSRGDANLMFEAMQQLKPKYNEVFGRGDKIPAGKSEDFMVEARFELPKTAVDQRKGVLLHLEDVDGTDVDIAENEAK